MSSDEFIEAVTRFNECISTRDMDGLSALMSDDHVFIDCADNTVRGKHAVVAAWRDRCLFRRSPLPVPRWRLRRLNLEKKTAHRRLQAGTRIARHRPPPVSDAGPVGGGRGRAAAETRACAKRGGNGAAHPARGAEGACRAGGRCPREIPPRCLEEVERRYGQAQDTFAEAARSLTAVWRDLIGVNSLLLQAGVRADPCPLR